MGEDLEYDLTYPFMVEGMINNRLNPFIIFFSLALFVCFYVTSLPVNFLNDMFSYITTPTVLTNGFLIRFSNE